ncbi:transporter substrate-binding domain-containing protein [Treponema primitia]|uniref:transporter substrate-binding domain-containing protein n=1 Tax=Treponema primitia TaxID=88058 RepID=UPI003980130C
MKKIFVLILPMIAAVLVFSVVSCKKADTKEGTLVVVGTGKTYEPYCYLDANGNLVGFEKAVLDEVDRRLPQYYFSYETYDFANVLISLATKKVDIGAHEFEENPERRATYLYGEEGYNDYDSYVVVNTLGKWANVNSIDEFAGNPDPGAIVGVSTASNHEAFVKTYNANHDANHQIKFQAFSDDEVMHTELGSGRIAARISMLGDIQRANALQGLKLELRGDPVILSKAYFIFRKDASDLQKAVDGALREMKADGTWEKIKQKEIADYYAKLQK